jgi:tRNA pseudouridine55 synthase
MAGTKRYRATIRFGASSSTDDSEGTISASATAPTFSMSDLEAALIPFLGDIDQIPPAYAAIKVAGRPMYERARAGESITVPARRVRIDDIAIESFHDSVAVVDVTCSKGTYIRALARDLGQQLGTSAYLAALQRTQSGGFRVDDSVDLDTIQRAGRDGYLDRLLYPLDAAVAGWPAVVLSPVEAKTVAQGGRWNGLPGPTGACLRAYDEMGRLIAFLQSPGLDAAWRPTTVFIKDHLDDVA